MSPTEIYTLSLHDALPISSSGSSRLGYRWPSHSCGAPARRPPSSAGSPSSSCRPGPALPWRSEEHTSELQSHSDLVCRLLLEKKSRDRQQTVARLVEMFSG